MTNAAAHSTNRALNVPPEASRPSSQEPSAEERNALFEARQREREVLYARVRARTEKVRRDLEMMELIEASRPRGIIRSFLSYIWPL